MKKAGGYITCFMTIITITLAAGCSNDARDQSQTQTAVTAAPPSVVIDNDDIGGVVTSTDGPEAGVWVIAETDAFETMYARIVTTDDQGRYLIPDLPQADYEIWVRGYGLADSTRVKSRPGNHLDLTAIVAVDEATAARVYPAAYWYAMMKLPEESELVNVNGGLNAYLMWMKNMACVGCHQMGNLATRTLPEELGEFESSIDAWRRRMQSGQAGNFMTGLAAGPLGGLPFKYLADWSDRIAAGELPASRPERPRGIERNVVVTVRDWSNPKAYMHDLSGTDRRDPTVNGYGLLYGAPELSTDEFPILDPVNNAATVYNAPVRDADTPTTKNDPVIAPSPYWGEERIWDSKANAHNPMLDETGRVWYTARIRGPNNPDFCKQGSDHPSAKLFPVDQSGRHIAVLDPKTGDYTFVDTCYSTHHLQFAEDENDTLWTSGGGQVLGWLDTKIFDETGDAAAAQGWAPLVLDTNGNGKLDEWVEPNEAVDPNKDKRIPAGFYAIMPNPVDGSVWGSNAFGYPGGVVRYDPKTMLGEVYRVPLPGFGVRPAMA